MTNPRIKAPCLKLETLLSAMRLTFRAILGWLLNTAGLPGFVAECDYSASIIDATVRVRKHLWFTVINVNGLDIYFHRLTGALDGVGFSPAAGCTRGPVEGLAGSAGRPSVLPETTQTENQPVRKIGRAHV